MPASHQATPSKSRNQLSDSMKARIKALNLSVLLALSTPLHADFVPGEVWFDTKGIPINAHAGGILHEEGIFYWYGQPMSSLPPGPAFPPSAGNLTEAGVSLYTSNDLYNWHNEGLVLQVSEDKNNDLYKGLRIERPKVVRSPATGQYVMWFHYVRSGLTHAQSFEAAVCTSTSPKGPFQLIRIFRPHGGQMVRDCTLFQDRDGETYFIYASEENATLHIAKLNRDCLDVSDVWIRALEGRFREAPALFRKGEQVFLITSGCTGWKHNQASWASAPHPLGPWTEQGDPCIEDNSHTTFDSQGTFVLSLPGKENSFIFMADRWDTKSMSESRHIWLPISFDSSGNIRIEWKARWHLEDI
jgi:hypothetical protein